MSTESILEKIRRQCREQVREIEKNGREEAERRHKEAMDAAQQDAQTMLDKASRDAAQIAQQAQLSAQLEARKNNLAARRRMLDKAFALALAKMNEASDDARHAYLEKLVLENAPAGEAVLTVAAKDRAFAKENLAAWCKKLEAQKGSSCVLTLSDADGAFTGGAYLTGADYDVDASYERIVEEIRADEEPEIARTLFGEE